MLYSKIFKIITSKKVIFCAFTVILFAGVCNKSEYGLSGKSQNGEEEEKGNKDAVLENAVVIYNPQFAAEQCLKYKYINSDIIHENNKSYAYEETKEESILNVPINIYDPYAGNIY